MGYLLDAIAAVAAEKNFRDLAESIAARAAARRELKGEVIEARDFAAVDAHKMRMLAFVSVHIGPQLEAAGLIAEIEAGQDTSFG